MKPLSSIALITLLSLSEQTHKGVIRDKLAQYNLPAPNPETNNLSESLGIFSGEE